MFDMHKFVVTPAASNVYSTRGVEETYDPSRGRTNVWGFRAINMLSLWDRKNSQYVQKAHRKQSGQEHSTAVCGEPAGAQFADVRR